MRVILTFIVILIIFIMTIYFDEDNKKGVYIP